MGSLLYCFFFFQALAATRVQITPIEGGPNDSTWLHSQAGLSRNRKFSGSGSDTDIVIASARAYVSALNKLLTWNQRRREQQANGATDTTIEDDAIGDAQPATQPAVSVVASQHSP